MASVYLETSFFSACVSTRTGEKIAGWRASSNEWWATQAKEYDLFISPEVIIELSSPDFLHGQIALEMLAGLNVIEFTADIEELARLLVDEKVMPGPAIGGDAMHVAAATMHEIDYILTWNVKHLANPNERHHFAIICMRLGLTPPLIVTPDMLPGEDDEFSTEEHESK